MAKITNTTKANIHVTTEAGEFVFKAGETLELADERAAMVADKGAVYFTVGELVSDAEIAEEHPAEAGVSVVEDATKSVAEESTAEAKPADEVKPVETEKPAPAAVKATVKPAPAAKK